VVFLKVTRAGSPARDLNTTGMWSCAQQNFDVLVEQALLPVRLCRTEITSNDREDLSHLKFQFGIACCRSSVMLTPTIPHPVVVARVPECIGMHNPHFRRGDFLRNCQPNPHPGSTGMSYNHGARREQTHTFNWGLNRGRLPLFSTSEEPRQRGPESSRRLPER
jgi:hypothetical protein